MKNLSLILILLFTLLSTAYSFELSEKSVNLAKKKLESMSLREKIGQMTQAERQYASPRDVKRYALGSILSGGGSVPSPNVVESWKKMTDKYLKASLRSSSEVPLLYGVDAVHGHNNIQNATIFPHNIGLGATRNKKLMKEMAKVVADEMKASGIIWNFSPTTAVAKDLRWGRFYESFSSDTDLVTSLSISFMEGLQNNGILATPKHFLGDGGTTKGIDRGNTEMSESELRHVHLPPYIEALKKGALSIMVSFSSVNGEKLHGSKYWVSDVLKKELGFKGFVVSDWNGIEELKGSYKEQIEKSVNAGVDMFMVPERWKEFMTLLTELVNEKSVSLSRIDDAVTRILAVKYEIGLFQLKPGEAKTYDFGTKENRKVAEKAVRESLVLLKNENSILPLNKNQKIIVSGKTANNTGLQCGGWTLEWQGTKEQVPGATSILKGLKDKNENVEYISTENLKNIADSKFDVAIAVIGENPYTEMFGDIIQNEDDLLEDRTPYGTSIDFYDLHPEDQKTINELQKLNIPIVTLFVTGRPLFSNKLIKDSSAFVAAWLPGSEGHAISDVLFGEFPFTGKLPVSWPGDLEMKTELFPVGHPNL